MKISDVEDAKQGKWIDNQRLNELGKLYSFCLNPKDDCLQRFLSLIEFTLVFTFLSHGSITTDKTRTIYEKNMGPIFSVKIRYCHRGDSRFGCTVRTHDVCLCDLKLI